MIRNILLILILCLPFYLNDIFYMYLVNGSMVNFLIIDLILFVLIPLTTIYIYFKKQIFTLEEIGLTKNNILKNIIYGFVLFLILLTLINYFVGPAVYSISSIQNHSKILLPHFGNNLFIVLYLSITSSIIEETVFRGIVTSKLKNITSNIFLLVFVSCLLFSLIHWGEGIPKVLITFFWAIIPTIWIIKYKNLSPLIFCHFFYNFFVFSGFLMLME